MSGGLITTVTFDEVEPELTKEEALSMSKEDLVAYLYGDDVVVSEEEGLTPEEVAFEASESPTVMLVGILPVTFTLSRYSPRLSFPKTILLAALLKSTVLLPVSPFM